jgi:hypothetical protein
MALTLLQVTCLNFIWRSVIRTFGMGLVYNPGYKYKVNPYFFLVCTSIITFHFQRRHVSFWPLFTFLLTAVLVALGQNPNVRPYVEV